MTQAVIAPPLAAEELFNLPFDERVAALVERMVRQAEVRGFEAARLDIVNDLKQLHVEGHRLAEAELMLAGSGIGCASFLSQLQDLITHALFRFCKKHLYPRQNPTPSEDLTVVAVGGYGRGLMAPGSDVDILFILPYKKTAWGETVVESMLYMMWDMGLKVGHATRSVEECIGQAKVDMTIRTAMLEARFLAGNAELFDAFRERFQKDVMQNTAKQFVAAKLQERDDRHKRSGTSRYRVEPNIKEGKGGLRDLNTLFWIAKYVYKVGEASELLKVGVFSRSELNTLRKCDDFLWTVRCHLHFQAKRAEERLSFDFQREMAARLGYQDHPGQSAVERFMKHYFLIAKDVGDLTRILCAALEESHVKDAPSFNRFFEKLSRKYKSLPKEFVVQSGRLSVANQDVFEKKPVNILKLFWYTQQLDISLHPDALQLARRSLKFIDRKLREDKEANKLFLDVLCESDDPEALLRIMNEAGVLGRFVPDFGKVVAMMQFNMYHHYTVDEHLIRSIGVLRNIDNGALDSEHPLSSELIKTVRNKRLLYVALFLHDIAKGRPEDHSIAGAKVARKLCPRFGLDERETELVAWLVEEHLTMSLIAQQRDINDPRTISNFAETVHTMERLKLLLILTVCDIKAVGPGVWNGWKGQLLRTLYSETEIFLTGGQSGASRAQRVQSAQAMLQANLKWDEDRFALLTRVHEPAYWLKVSVEDQVKHAALIEEVENSGQRFASQIFTSKFQEITEITLLATDTPLLLATIAAACTREGASIADAQIFTTRDGRALDVIYVRRVSDDDQDEHRRANNIVRTLCKMLDGEEPLPKPQATAVRPKGRLKAFKRSTAITISNDLSETFTVLEADGLDSQGLLYRLSHAIGRLKLNISSAHIATFGEQAVDVFYVSELDGKKVDDEARIKAIKRALENAFEVA